MPTKLIILILLLAPTLVFAQSYEPLVGIPGVDGGGDFDTYINAIYALSISIAALLAVIKIIIAGVKWMTTDIVTSKSDAKKDIKGALLGLLVILAAVLIINIINPNIAEVDLSINQVTAPTGEGLYEGAAAERLQEIVNDCSARALCAVNSCTSETDCANKEESCLETGGALLADGSEEYVLCQRAGAESENESDVSQAEDIVRERMGANYIDFDIYAIGTGAPIAIDGTGEEVTISLPQIEEWAETCLDTGDTFFDTQEDADFNNSDIRVISCLIR